MADYPPFMNSYGQIPKILNKITEAKTPARFSQEFLATALGFPGGSPKPFIPLLKRIGFLSSDGVPTELYKRFRNPDERGAAMAEALRSGYSDVFARNEYAYKLDKPKLQGLITEMTGLDSKHGTIGAIVNTFWLLKEFADFEASGKSPALHRDAPDSSEAGKTNERTHAGKSVGGDAPSNGLKFSYTIYLNLPNTDNIAVFNAIFKSLKENLPIS